FTPATMRSSPSGCASCWGRRGGRVRRCTTRWARWPRPTGVQWLTRHRSSSARPHRSAMAAGSPGGSAASLFPLLGAALLPAPWIVVRAAGSHLEPAATSALTGLAILGAAFLLAWAAELLQLEISQALALALLALIA